MGDTTKLTAVLAIGVLLGFGWASRVLGNGADPFRMAAYGALVGLAAFACVILAGVLSAVWLFAAGTLLIGFGAGLFGHGTLTATMNLAPRRQTGLALGAWGAAQASAAGMAIALDGIIRDAATGFTGPHGIGPALAYDAVYGIEMLLLLATLATMLPLLRSRTGVSPAPARSSFDAPRTPSLREMEIP